MPADPPDITEEQLSGALLGAILANLKLGHTDLRTTVQYYLHIDEETNPAGWVVRQALLGDCRAIKDRFPEFVRALNDGAGDVMAAANDAAAAAGR